MNKLTWYDVFYTTLEGKREEAHVLPVLARNQKEAHDKCRKIVLANTGLTALRIKAAKRPT